MRQTRAHGSVCLYVHLCYLGSFVSDDQQSKRASKQPVNQRHAALQLSTGGNPHLHLAVDPLSRRKTVIMDERAVATADFFRLLSFALELTACERALGWSAGFSPASRLSPSPSSSGIISLVGVPLVRRGGCHAAPRRQPNSEKHFRESLQKRQQRAENFYVAVKVHDLWFLISTHTHRLGCCRRRRSPPPPPPFLLRLLDFVLFLCRLRPTSTACGNLQQQQQQKLQVFYNIDYVRYRGGSWHNEGPLMGRCDKSLKVDWTHRDATEDDSTSDSDHNHPSGTL